jgi:hypothetical protein|tara:strand:+ start:649 stop:1296 length:648 start_codon:yes stop_codon:yes gene_type:complete
MVSVELVLPDGFSPITPKSNRPSPDMVVITSNGDVRFGSGILEQLGELPAKIIQNNGKDKSITKVVTSSNYIDGLVFQFFGITDSFITTTTENTLSAYSYSAVKSGINGYSTLMNCGIEKVLQLLDPENNGGQKYNWSETKDGVEKGKAAWLLVPTNEFGEDYITSIGFSGVVVDEKNKTIQVSTDNMSYGFSSLEAYKTNKTSYTEKKRIGMNP